MRAGDWHDDAELAALARAAQIHGLQVDARQLLAVVRTAYAPHETMTAAERAFLMESGAPADSFDAHRQAAARALLSSLGAATRANAWPTLSSKEMADKLGVTMAAVQRRQRLGTLYAVRDPWSRRLHFPAWQVIDNQPLPGLRRVLRALPTAAMHPLSIEGFMTNPQEELDSLSPVQWLSEGRDINAVVELAESVAWT